MKAHVTIAFYGDYRPIHAEGESLESAIRSMRGKIDGSPRESLDSLWRGFQRQRKAGVSIHSSTLHGSGFNVTIAERKRDPWLDSITSNLPVSPWERGEA